MSIFRRYALPKIQPRLPKADSPATTLGQIERLEVREMFASDAASFLSPIWFEQLSTSAHAQIDAGDATFAQSTAQVVWQNSTLDVYDDEWIIQLDVSMAGSINSLSEVATLLDGESLQFEIIGGLGLSGQLLIRTFDAEISAVTQWLADQTIVTTFEPNALLPAHLATSDPQGDSLWGLDNVGQTGGTPDADIDAPEAWEITTGNSNTVVAVIDTGVDYSHPDLIQNMWVNPGEIAGDGIDNDGNGFVDDVYGYDFLNNDGDPMDDNMHGTHVAGTIAAAGDNETGVVGVASSASIMALKFLSASGSGSTADAVRALNYATMMKKLYGVNVVATNNSWGGGEYSSALYSAIQASGDADILFVAAAGNDGANNDVTPQYPANYGLDNVISVAATDHNDQLANFSNYGAGSVDIAAPGVGIVSTITRGRYLSLSGTSMAAPHVSGVIALAYGANPTATMDQIKAAVLGGADDLDNLHGQVSTGGRLNALGTLHQLNFSVVDASIAEGASIDAPLSEFSIDFSGAFDLSTLSAEDFSVNGQTADSYVVDGNRVTFQFEQTPITTQGVQRIELSAGAIERAGDGMPLSSFTRTFFYDAASLNVAETNIADGDVLSALPPYLDLTFNEAIDPSSLDLKDLQLSSGSVVAVERIGDRTARFWLDLPHDNAQVAYQLADGAVTDLYGNGGAAYQGSFVVDLADVAIYETTGPITLPAYGSIDIPLSIDDNFPIVDADIWLDIDHTWVSDLTAVLIAPDGTEIPLFSAIGGSGDHFDGTIFDDDAAMSIADADAPFSGRFLPSGDLSLLEGMSTAGNWTLRLSDSFASDVGTLQKFGIHFTIDAPLELDPLDDVTAHHSQSSIDVDVASSPGALISAAVIGDAPVELIWNAEKGRLTITPSPGFVGDFAIRISATRGEATVWEEFGVSIVNDAVQLGEIADQTLAHDQLLDLPLAIENQDDDPLTYIVTATDADGNLVDAKIDSGRFQLDAGGLPAGEVQVVISVSDGVSTAARSFSVTVLEAPVSAEPLPAEFVGAPGETLVVDLAQYDFAQGAVRFEVAGSSTMSSPFSQYGIVQDAWLERTNFAYNTQRQGEKYLKGVDGRLFYLTTDGEQAYLHLWQGSFSRSHVIATIDVAYFEDPTLFYEAGEASPPADVEVALDERTGMLRITPQEGFVGRVTLTVSASGPQGTETRTIDVVFEAEAFEFSSIANDQFSESDAQYRLDLQDYVSGDDVTFSAVATAASNAKAYQIDEQLNFVHDPFLSQTGYAFNAYGQQEKFIRNADFQWYFLKQEAGQAVLYKWTADLEGSQRVATLDIAYYEDPSLLVNTVESSGAVSARIEDGVLVVERPANFVGDVVVTVTASSGDLSATQAFRISAAPIGGQPVLRAIDTTAISHDQAPRALSESAPSLQAHVAAIAAEVALRYADEIDAVAQSRADAPNGNRPQAARSLAGAISQSTERRADQAAAYDGTLAMPTLVGAMDDWSDQIAQDLGSTPDAFSSEADDLYSSLASDDFELPEM